jgi:chemotaxis signal transduction protein
MTKEMKAAAAHNETKKHDRRENLSFFLAEERYGLEMLKVQEIKGCMGLIPVMPAAPAAGWQTTCLSDQTRKKISGN